MPLYEYRCERGHTFEAVQRMSDDPVTSCEVCGAPVQRVFHPVAVHFKGSGFYATDYGRKKSGTAASSDDSGGKSSSDSGGKSSSSDSGGKPSSSDSGSSKKATKGASSGSSGGTEN